MVIIAMVVSKKATMVITMKTMVCRRAVSRIFLCDLPRGIMCDITLTFPWDGAPPRKGPPGGEKPQNGIVP